MLLAGFTGQVSLGHAAFLGMGAYTEAVLTCSRAGPFALALARWRRWSAGGGRGGRACRRCA
jgi:branched-chain amino acid transport system permease protein